MWLRSTPILELPGFELPWRQGLHPPLYPPIRRPVTEARSFLDLRFDHVPDHPTPDLAGRLADHIDEFRLVRHGSLLAKYLATSIQCAPNTLTTSFGDASSCGNDALPPLPDIDKMPGDRGCRRHCRRDQMGAALESLAALEIAIRGRGAALFGFQLVGVHRKAHRAARLAPFEAGLDEDLVEAFGFGLLLHDARARYDHRIDVGIDGLALGDL